MPMPGLSSSGSAEDVAIVLSADIDMNAVEKKLDSLEKRFNKKADLAGGLADIAGRGIGGGIGGQDIANIAGSLGAGSMAQAGIGLAAKIIEAPFKAMATVAQQNVESMQALNSELGVTAVGFTKTSQALKQIPIIGEHLAAMKDAQRQELEINVGYAAKYLPAVADRLHQAADDLRAAKGMGQIGTVDRLTRANEVAADVQLAINEMVKRGEATEEQVRGAEKHPTLARAATGEEARIAGLVRLRQSIEEAEKGLTTTEARNKRAEAEELLGRGLGSAKGLAARPAQMNDFLSYQRDLQLKAFSQGGVDPQQETSKTLKDLFDWLKSRADDQNDTTGVRALMQAWRRGLEG